MEKTLITVHFLGISELHKRVFRLREAASESDNEEGRIMIDDLGVREGCKICGIAR